MSTTARLRWFEQIPKIELHVHLEGAIPYDTLWELVQKYGGDGNVPDKATLIQQFEYTDFAHFIETWVWKNQFIREYDDFTMIAEAVARDFAAQNIRYAEVFYPHQILQSMVYRLSVLLRPFGMGLSAYQR